MANLFGKECGSNIYKEPANNCDPCSKGFSLRRNYVLVGNENSQASQVRLDPAKFEVVGIDCDKKQLTLKKLFHKDLLGLGEDDHLQYVHVSLTRTIGANHIFTGNPEFRGRTLFSGTISIEGQLTDQVQSPGASGQALLSTANGVRWTSISSENVYWVSKSGSDSNDGRSEATAKATIKSALNEVNKGYRGKLQDAANLILANKKLIQEESLGYLMTETDLEAFEFPQEVDLDVKAQAARQTIFTNLETIITNVLNQVPAAPEGEIVFMAKNIANDLLWGGYEGARNATSVYFGIDNNFLDELVSPEQRDDLVSALVNLEANINNTLNSTQPGYFNSLTAQVSDLTSYMRESLSEQSLVKFPSKTKDQTFREQVYYNRYTIANEVWSEIVLDYPTLASEAKSYREKIRTAAIAVAEDIVSGGNSNTFELASSFLEQNVFSSPLSQSAAAEMFLALGTKLQELITSFEVVNSNEYLYIRNHISSLLANLSATITGQSLLSLPEKDSGFRNISVKTCKRDIGHFIDAIASDLKNGGNQNTIEFAEAYYDSQNVIYIDGELQQTIATLNKARDLMVLAIRGWKLDGDNSLYQPVYSFEDIFINKKVIVEAYPACTDVENTINTYCEIIEEIFNNGPRAEYKAAREIIFSNISEIIQSSWEQTALQYPSLRKTELTCKRDLGFIIEAIAEDVYKSSNVNMREATQAYFGQNQELIVDGLVDEESASIYAFERVRDYIINTLLTGPAYGDVRNEVTSLVNILITAISSNSLAQLPPANQGTWGIQPDTFKAQIIVRSGVYLEDNPLEVPPNVAINGDDLRSTTVLAKNRVFDVFHVNNGSKITNLTFSDHLYPSAAVSFPQLNNQGTAGIISRSPYIQNCTSKTLTGAGMRVDGRLAEGFKSMVLDSYTQYNQGGTGVDILNRGYAQLVSLFTINCEVGIHTRTGGQCDLNNSNISFGNYGMVADGASEMEFMGQVAQFTKAGSTQVLIKNLGSTKPYNGQVLYFGAPYFSLKSAKVLDPGTGYIKAPTVSISSPTGPLGTPARARCTIFNDSVNEVTVVREGRGYTTRTPNSTVQSPPPGGSTAQLDLNFEPIYYIVASSTDIQDGTSLVTLATPVTYDLEPGTSVPFFRQSKILASSISLEYVGSGTNDRESLPFNNGTEVQDNEVDMRNGGSVIFTSTDQSGNFRIGDGVIIDQATGIIGGVSFSRGLFAQITPLIIALN